LGRGTGRAWHPGCVATIQAGGIADSRREPTVRDHQNHDTTGGDGGDGGIASIAGGAGVASGGGAGTMFGSTAATGGARSDSLLVPDVVPPDGPQAGDPAQAQAGEEVGGSFLSPAAGDGVSPV
jgi:hypothetical protein